MPELFTSESQEAEFYKALSALYQDQQRVQAEITLAQAWSLLSTVQFAASNPLATDSDSIKRAIRAIQRLEPTIVGNSEVLQELANAGWERRVPRVPVESSVAALEQGKDDITLELRKSEVYCLIAAIQLAQRHQEYGTFASARISRQIAEDLQNAIAPDGILAEVLQAGWDENFDVKVSTEANTKKLIVEENTLYRHFKGGLYYVHCVGRHTETEEAFVVYQEAEIFGSGNIGLLFDKIWCRPLDNFCSDVEVDGVLVPRFTLLTE